MGLHLVLGGARSGKSTFAESAAREISQEYAASPPPENGGFQPGQRLYLALHCGRPLMSPAPGRRRW